jgi:hypothetical protein
MPIRSIVGDIPHETRCRPARQLEIDVRENGPSGGIVTLPGGSSISETPGRSGPLFIMNKVSGMPMNSLL